MTECTRAECAGKETHPARYHVYDDAVFNTSRMRGIEKLYDAFRDELHTAILEFGDIPYPTEFEPDENGIDDYREWYTTQVILQLLNP